MTREESIDRGFGDLAPQPTLKRLPYLSDDEDRTFASPARKSAEELGLFLQGHRRMEAPPTRFLFQRLDAGSSKVLLCGADSVHVPAQRRGDLLGGLRPLYSQPYTKKSLKLEAGPFGLPESHKFFYSRLADGNRWSHPGLP